MTLILKHITRDKDGEYCFYCREKVSKSVPETHPKHLTKDHVIPKSKGGRQFVDCCYRCNQLKADMGLYEWIEALPRDLRELVRVDLNGIKIK